MPGGLLNLVSIGNNSIILTGNPTKTFFKATYVKYTNFGLQKFRLDYTGQRTLNPTASSVFQFKIPRHADLLLDTYLVMSLPDIWSPILPPDVDQGNIWRPYEFQWIEHLGVMMIDEVLITCGGLTIQRYSGDYLLAMVERDFPPEKKELFHRMTGHIPALHDPANAYGRVNTYPSAYYSPDGAEPSIRGQNLYVPINTWFTLDSRCAFPLISLQYNELIIQVTIRPLQELYRIRDVVDAAHGFPVVRPDFNSVWFPIHRFLQTPPDTVLDNTSYVNTANTWNADIHLMTTYAFLSAEESKLFAAQDQVYLVKDVFRYEFKSITGASRQTLPSNGMVSSWMWYLQRSDVDRRNEWANYTNWPYGYLPDNIELAATPGPRINPDGFNSGLYITGSVKSNNTRDILQTMGILLNGEYRENVLERGVFDYVEKYTRTKGNAKPGLYCYNFCLNTSPWEYQPSGAINMSKFKDIQLEVTTIIPPLDPVGSMFNVICDDAGNAIGTQKGVGTLYQYDYDMVVFEERYNVLSFLSGNCGMLYSR